MDKGVQIWAVDISAYDLWDNESKGDNLICMLLGSAQEEQTKVKRYVREIDQIRSLAGKLLVRLAICTLRKDLKWDKLLFQITSQGRPFLSAPVLDFDYNITHDGDWVSIAFRGSCQDQEEVTPSVIGVDVMEMHLPHYEKSIEDFVDTLDISFTPREQQWVLAKDTDEEEPALSDTARQLKRLYTVWTYKEAFTKSKGLGLAFDFRNVEVERRASSVSLKTFGSPERGFSFCEIVLPAGKKSNRKQGAGTGKESLLVTATKDEDDESNHLKPMDATQAQQENLLRLWTMDDLVKASLEAYNNT